MLPSLPGLIHFQVNIQREHLDGRALPTLDYPTNEDQERDRLSQVNAGFKAFYILPCLNLLWQISLLIILGSGWHYNK